MSNTDTRLLRDVLQDHLSDSEFLAEWEAKAPARVIAMRLVQYRAEKGLSQTKLGRLLGMSQPAVARLESGEHVPTLPSLVRIADALDIEILVDIRPANRPETWVDSKTESVARSAERIRMSSGQEFLVAAS